MSPPIAGQAADVAKVIIDQIGAVDQTKLQKLLYYCQALSLVWYGAPLFPERIEAWSNGPVVAEFWRRHAYEAYIVAVPEARPPLDPHRTALLVSQILKSFGKLSGTQLSELTHREVPWQAARGSLPDTARSSAGIDLGTIRDYYARAWSSSSR